MRGDAFRVPEIPLPCPLAKNKSCDTYPSLFGSEILDGGTHLIKMPKLLSTFREDLSPVSVLMMFFLCLYLLLAALLITRLQDDYRTGSGIPSACDPPDALLRGTPRSKLSVPQSLCT